MLFNDNTHSSPYLTNNKTNTYKNKINKLKEINNRIWLKEELNNIKGHAHKAQILKIERLRIRSKISRLKIGQSHTLANHIVQIADQYNSIIHLEQLNWVPNSKWDQARQQDMIQEKARLKNIKTKKINPKNTSNNCPTCGNLIKHSQRATHCTPCNKTLNRDILASRNIAQNNKPKQTKQKSLQTQLAKPATTGELPNYVIKFSLKTQEIQHN